MNEGSQFRANLWADSDLAEETLRDKENLLWKAEGLLAETDKNDGRYGARAWRVKFLADDIKRQQNKEEE